MSRIPVNNPYSITTEFGEPDSNALFGYHSGIDYAGFGAGRPIYAPTSGELTNVKSPTGGNMVVIRANGYVHRLMHNSSFSRENGHVNEGEEVAKAGTTGLSTGVHCHWDINNQGTYPNTFQAFINPNEWLKQGEDMNVNQDQLDKICWLATGLSPKSNQNFQNNLGNPLDTVLDNFMGYTETKNLHLDAEAYRAGAVAPTKVVINGVEYIPKK